MVHGCPIPDPGDAGSLRHDHRQAVLRGRHQWTADPRRFAYDPAKNKWSKIANLPIDLSAPVYGASGGHLLVATGVTDDGTVTTNQGLSYDPGTGTWSSLPDANNAVFRAGGTTDADGNLYEIGGTDSIANAPFLANAEVLPSQAG